MSPLLNLRAHTQRNLHSHPYQRSATVLNQQVNQISSSSTKNSNLNYAESLAAFSPIYSGATMKFKNDLNNNTGTTTLTELISSQPKVDTLQRFSTLSNHLSSQIQVGDVSFAVPSAQKRIRSDPYSNVSTASNFSNQNRLYVRTDLCVTKTIHKPTMNKFFNNSKIASADVSPSKASLEINQNRLNFTSAPTDCVVDYAIVNQNSHIGSDIQHCRQLSSLPTPAQPSTDSTKMPSTLMNGTHSTAAVDSNHNSLIQNKSSSSSDHSHFIYNLAMQHSPSHRSSPQLGFGQLISMSSEAICHDSLQSWTPTVRHCNSVSSADLTVYNGFGSISTGNGFHEYGSSPAHSNHSMSSQYSAGESSGRSSPTYSTNPGSYVGRSNWGFEPTVGCLLPSTGNESFAEQQNYSQQHNHQNFARSDSSYAGQSRMYQHQFGEHSPTTSESKRSISSTNESTDTFVLKRNERERTRVKYVNDGFEMLREHLPIENSKRMSKVQTLKFAIDYIRKLEQQLGLDSETLLQDDQD